MMKKITLLFTLAALLCSTASYAAPKKAKYVFYFIGDGMSATQLNLAEAAINYESFSSDQNGVAIGKLNIRKFPVTGLINTHAANRYITCSAAAATALATGNKTNIDFISVSAEDGTTPLPTIAERAKQSGMKVGIVTSVSIDHATPACFYAHTGYRDNYKVIGSQLLSSGFDYFAGGSPRWNKHGAESNAQARDIFVASAHKAGYKYIATREGFESMTSSTTPVIATLNMLGGTQNPYADDSFALPYAIDLERFDKQDQITLADFTAKGAEVLTNEKGFFMMIESGKIDWACHANDAVTTAHEVIAFDQAIGKAIEFYNQHPEETLIIVTGDHDTGGLTLGFAGTSYENSFNLLSKQKISYVLFQSEYKKRFNYTYNPQDKYADVAKDKDFLAAFSCALQYAGEQLGLVDTVDDNGSSLPSYTKKSTQKDNIIGSLDKMTDAGRFELSNYEVELLKETFFQSVSGNRKKSFASDDIYKYLMEFAGYDPFTTTCLTILCNKAGIEFSTYAHTAVPIPVFALGVGAESFTGYYDNTDVPKKISAAAGLDL